MIVLALDSSADTVAVAVLRDDEPLAERSWRMPRPTGRGGPQGGLLGVADASLADARVAPAAVEFVAVATGPGSFNGIRAGIAVAEGLALALGVPAAGVPTLDALAYQHVGRAGVVCAVLPAGRGEYYGATYTGMWMDWRRRSDYVCAAAAEPTKAAAQLEFGPRYGARPPARAGPRVRRLRIVAAPVPAPARHHPAVTCVDGRDQERVFRRASLGASA